MNLGGRSEDHVTAIVSTASVSFLNQSVDYIKFYIPSLIGQIMLKTMFHYVSLHRFGGWTPLRENWWPGHHLASPRSRSFHMWSPRPRWTCRRPLAAACPVALVDRAIWCIYNPIISYNLIYNHIYIYIIIYIYVYTYMIIWYHIDHIH